MVPGPRRNRPGLYLFKHLLKKIFRHPPGRYLSCLFKGGLNGGC
jgi:hypothetical protein